MCTTKRGSVSSRDLKKMDNRPCCSVQIRCRASKRVQVHNIETPLMHQYVSVLACDLCVFRKTCKFDIFKNKLKGLIVPVVQYYCNTNLIGNTKSPDPR